MCKFAEKDLRLAATRNMTDIVWQVGIRGFKY